MKNKKDSTVVVAVIGVIGTITVAAIGLISTRSQLEIPIQATQTAAAQQATVGESNASQAGSSTQAGEAGVAKSCAPVYADSVPSENQIYLEAGVQEYSVSVSNTATGNEFIGPYAAEIGSAGKRIGGIVFLVSPKNAIFKIMDVVDERCKSVSSLSIADRPGQATTLQNWDTLQIYFPAAYITIRFGWTESTITFYVSPVQ